MKKITGFSRHLLGLGVFLGFTLMIQAQAALTMLDISVYERPPTKTTPIAKVNSHSTDAIKQLSSHIKEHLVYPEYLRDFGFDGTVVIELNLDRDGRIINHHLVKRVTSSLDAAVIASLKTFSKVETSESIYQGVNTVHIPIRFTK